MSEMSNKKGFTLVEVLIYTGILAISGALLSNVLFNATKIKGRETASIEVNDQLNFALQNIQRSVMDSSVIDITSGESTSTLNLKFKDNTQNPTKFYITDGVLYKKVADNAAQPVTSSNVVADAINFLKVQGYTGHDSVQVDLTLSYNTASTSQDFAFSRSLSSAIARVSAATFDSNLIPGADNNYDIGQTSARWNNMYLSGNLGIGTTAPTSKLTISATDNSTATVYKNGLGVDTNYYVDNTFANTNITNPTAGYNNAANLSYLNFNPSSSFANQIDNRYALTIIPSTNSSAITNGIIGSMDQVFNYGSGLTNYLYGTYGDARNYGAGSTVAGIRGVTGIAGNATNGNDQFSTTTQSVAIYANSLNSTTNGLITNRYGVYSGASNSGTITNAYGFYATGWGVGGTHTNTAYDFYGSDTGAWNYFAGNVGIGTTEPASKLTVSAIDVTNPTVYMSATSSNMAVYVENRMASTTITSPKSGMIYSNFDILRIDPSSTITQQTDNRYGLTFIPPTNSQTISSSILGSYDQVLSYGSGNVTTLYGQYGYVANGGAGGTVTNLRGVQAFAGNNAPITGVNQFSTTTNATALYANVGNSTSNGLITTAYGVYSVGSNSGTITNSYGVIISGWTTGTRTITPYDLYANDSGAWNYFAGNVGIGTTNPVHKLQVDASSGTFAQGLRLSYNNNAYGHTFVTGTDNKLYIGRGASGSESISAVIDTSGNVGIGTTAPVAQLDVRGNGGAGGYAGIIANTTNTDTYHGLLVSNTYNTASNFVFRVKTNTATPETNGMDLFAIKGDGNVGIGTTNPGSKLSVVGLPTSSAGLSTGDIWVDAANGNVLKVIPPP